MILNILHIVFYIFFTLFDCDSLTTVIYGETAEVTVSVLPAAASAGKTLNVKAFSITKQHSCHSGLLRSLHICNAVVNKQCLSGIYPGIVNEILVYPHIGLQHTYLV